MKFKRNTGAFLLVVVALVAVVAVVGCAKKTPAPNITEESKTGSGDQGGGGKQPDGSGGAATDTPGGAEDQEKGLQDVFFAYDEYALTSEARNNLSQNAGYLREMSGLRVTIEGHCDERGTVEYNLALGQRRADAARSYLVDLGIDAGRLSTISYGKERPFDPGHDETAWAKNRRAHFRVNNP